MNTQKLNWLNDDGINLPMINDVPRNEFYNKILAHNVKNKKCCDIGFGTGFLSLLALQHGAKQIIAYEKDPNRFELGQWVIKNLNLTSQIELRNDLANSDDIAQDKCDVVFHEIIHQSLWGEGVWYIRPRELGINYIPGTLFFELYAQEISDSTVAGFVSGNNDQYFNPGIDIDFRFINLINQLFLDNASKQIHKLTVKDNLFKTNWDLIHNHWTSSPRKVFHQGNKQLLAGYQVDYNNCQTTFHDSQGVRVSDLSNHNCQLHVDTTQWKSKNILLEPRFGLQHNGHRLYLADCRGWGEEAPWIFVKPTSNLIFDQDFSGQKFHFDLTKS